MAIDKNELILWLQTLKSSAVGIDAGGLCLRPVGNEDENAYIEVGGLPEVIPTHIVQEYVQNAVREFINPSTIKAGHSWRQSTMLEVGMTKARMFVLLTSGPPQSAWDIATKFSDYFAAFVRHLLPEVDVESFTQQQSSRDACIPMHFVGHNGRFYDAMNPEGVDGDPQLLKKNWLTKPPVCTEIMKSIHER